MKNGREQLKCNFKNKIDQSFKFISGHHFFKNVLRLKRNDICRWYCYYAPRHCIRPTNFFVVTLLSKEFRTCGHTKNVALERFFVSLSNWHCSCYCGNE